MKRRKLTRLIGAGLFVALFFAWFVTSDAQGPVTEQEASAIGVEAVIYGLPLIIAELSKRIRRERADAHEILPRAHGDDHASPGLKSPLR
jgi:hypothetical protein